MATSSVTLIEEYVSDEDFDMWIVAADVLLLPYRRAWSSGALARARLLGTRSIVSSVASRRSRSVQATSSSRPTSNLQSS